MDKVRVLVADENALVNDGICAVLGICESIDVVGAATSNEDIYQMVKEHAPDVVLIDIDLSLEQSADVIRWIHQENSAIKVLLLSESEDRDCILRGIKAGSNGYIPKRATSSELVKAILIIDRGGYFLYPSVAKTMVGEYLRVRQGLKPDPFDRLSDTEREVLKLLAEGYKNQQIAEALDTPIKKVIRHKANIVAKLGVRNRTELIKCAIRKHLIEL